MKSIILIACALVAIAVAAPPQEAKTVVQNYDRSPEGNYKYGFETENGIVRSEEGILKNAVDEDNKARQVLAVRGSFTYVDKDGNTESINYYADENGYHAEGPSVPKAPVARR